jgi:Flp pilus assembly protein TadG
MLTRLIRDTRATAMLEFAICLPVLMTLYFASYMVADVISCDRKVSIAARTLTDLLARGLSPSAITSNPAGTDATPYMSAAIITLTPYGIGHATEQVALLRICSPTQAYVVWSQAQTQDGSGNVTAATPVLTAPSAGATPTAANIVNLPTNMVTSTSYSTTNVTTNAAPWVPNAPTGICTNYTAPTGTPTTATAQVGTAGGYLFVSEVDYTYAPAIDTAATVPLSYHSYMSPRLN